MQRPDFIDEDESVSNMRSMVSRLKDNLHYERAILRRTPEGSAIAQQLRVEALEKMVDEATQWLGHLWHLQRAAETIAPPSFAGFEIGDRVRLPWKGVDATVTAFWPTFEPTHLECKDDAGRDHTVLPKDAKLYTQD